LAYSLGLSPSPGEVARLNDWLADVFADAAASPSSAEALRLCLNELVANVIEHGYPDGGEGRISIAIEPSDNALAVEVIDDGIAFDPLAAPEVQPMNGLQDVRIGGFGIKLFREASHSARYERSGGMNRLSFVCG